MLGILLVNKPVGLTSHDVVQQVRRKFGIRRVGHAGTLDPIADGLLVLAIGPATRFLQYLPLEPKEYVSRFTFGEATDTYDTEGDVIEEHPVPGDLDAQIGEALAQFKGEIQQLPPMYSAVKKAGQPLYKYARAGQEVQREPRTVYIDEYEPLGGEGADRSFRIVCSGGTYVRSLADDLGKAVGCGAHMSGLTRTQAGRFLVEDAVGMDEISPEHIRPLSESLPPMQLIELSERQVRMVREGRPVPAPGQIKGRFAGLVDENGNVFSVARAGGGQLQPECVIPEEAMRDQALS